MKHMNHSQNSQHSQGINHYVVMFVIMIFSGLLTTMNLYVDNFNDISLSLNDLYMILVMTGWMFLFMGIFYKDIKVFLIGLILVVLNIIAIRTQFLITLNQYLLGMIPHHSMAVHMSKKLIEKINSSNSNINGNSNNNTLIKPFLENIITTQNEEIKIMNKML